MKIKVIVILILMMLLIGCTVFQIKPIKNTSIQPTASKCGDNICDLIEKQRGICSQDCKDQTDNIIKQMNNSKISQPSCGDGICQTLESSGKISCPKDCGTSNEFSKSSLIKDISYDTLSVSQKLDLYLPKNISGKIPVIIYIHGGGFKAGDKSPCDVCNLLVKQNYAVASVNYRLSGEAIFPVAAYDVKSAVRWLRANAEKYNLDVNNFGAMGGSAGGHFAAFLGTTGDIKDFDMGNNLDYSSAVQAVVDQFGPVNFSSLAQDRIDKSYSPSYVESTYLGCNITLPLCENLFKASPISYVSQNDSPFFIIHGAMDNQIPIKQSQDFYNALQNVGVESQFTVVPNAGHGGSEFENYFDEYLEFFNKYLK